MDRRDFIASLGVAAVASHLPLWAAEDPSSGRITLLHTNDTHSHIEPFGPGNGPISGLGGVARRATLLRQLRQQLGSVLLLDAGDTFQGTPYFNRYKGRLDYQLMRMLGYDAGTLGNHDFDNGVGMLVEAMESMEQLQHSSPPFAFVNCNFDFKGAPDLGRRVQPAWASRVRAWPSPGWWLRRTTRGSAGRIPMKACDPSCSACGRWTKSTWWWCSPTWVTT
jgi:5'-nucleotidase